MFVACMSDSIEGVLAAVEQGKQPVGKYTVVRKIGEGAYTHVFEGHFDRFGRRKGAIKLPKSPDAKSTIEVRRVILSALGDCPFSTNIIDEGTVDDIPYLIEELREKTLGDVIRENCATQKKVSVDELRDLGMKLFTGIDYFHRLSETDPVAAEKLGIKSLTHCDIKPSNILKKINPKTGEIEWEYTDFCVVEERETDKRKKTPTIKYVSGVSQESIKSKDTDGNVRVYAAPEVRHALLLGEHPPTEVTADLWNIGAILFAYLTGRPPEWGEWSVKSVRKDLPDEVDEFFKKMLDGNPTNRPQTAKEAMSELEKSLESKADSYIVGFGRDETGAYYAFKQPMSYGKMRGNCITAECKYAEKVIAVIPLPKSDRTMFIYFEQNGNLRASVSDEVFNGKYHVTIQGKDLKEYKLRTVRNAQTGQVMLQAKVWFVKSEWSPFLGHDANFTYISKKCFELPTLAEKGEEEYKRCKPGIFFGDWEDIPHGNYFSNHTVNVQNGVATVYPNGSNTPVCTLPLKNVVQAVWVEK